MSDGPHRSLPMRSGWKRVAERGANSAFSTGEIASAIIPALEQDCRAELAPQFADDVCALLRERDSMLFKDDLRPQLEALRADAGAGIGRAFLDNVIHLTPQSAADFDIAAKAMTAALTDRAARCNRQVEEHYHRKSTAPRAQNTRNRIEKSIAEARIDSLARAVLKLDGHRPARRTVRQQGLDDGVRL